MIVDAVHVQAFDRRRRLDDSHAVARLVRCFRDVHERTPFLQQLARRAALRIEEEADLDDVQADRRASDARRARVEQIDQVLRNVELPRPVITTQRIAPAREPAKREFRPAR